MPLPRRHCIAHVAMGLCDLIMSKCFNTLLCLTGKYNVMERLIKRVYIIVYRYTLIFDVTFHVCIYLYFCFTWAVTHFSHFENNNYVKHIKSLRCYIIFIIGISWKIRVEALLKNSVLHPTLYMRYIRQQDTYTIVLVGSSNSCFFSLLYSAFYVSLEKFF